MAAAAVVCPSRNYRPRTSVGPRRQQPSSTRYWSGAPAATALLTATTAATPTTAAPATNGTGDGATGGGGDGDGGGSRQQLQQQCGGVGGTSNSNGDTDGNGNGNSDRTNNGNGTSNLAPIFTMHRNSGNGGGGGGGGGYTCRPASVPIVNPTAGMRAAAQPATWSEVFIAQAMKQGELQGPPSGQFLNAVATLADNIHFTDMGVLMERTTNTDQVLFGVLVAGQHGPVPLHGCVYDAKTTFNPTGTDRLWGLSGDEDKAVPMAAEASNFDMVNVQFPSVSALLRARSAATFEALTPATAAPAYAVRGVCALPAGLLQAVYRAEDTGYGGMAMHLISTFQQLDQHFSGGGQNAAFYQDALKYVLGWLWAAHQGKFQSVSLRPLSSARAKSYSATMHGRYLPLPSPTSVAPTPPAPAPGHQPGTDPNQVQMFTQFATAMTKMTETCGAISARLDVNSNDITTLSSTRAESSAKKSNWEKKWSDHSRQAMVHILGKYGPDDYDENGDSLHGQVRREPTPILKSIVDCYSWEQALQNIVMGVRKQSNIQLQISLATAGALRDGNFIPVSGCISQAWSVFCFCPVRKKQSAPYQQRSSADVQSAVEHHIAAGQQTLSEKQISTAAKVKFGAVTTWDEAKDACSALAAVYRYFSSVYKTENNVTTLVSQGKMHGFFMKCVTFLESHGLTLSELLPGDPLLPMRYMNALDTASQNYYYDASVVPSSGVPPSDCLEDIRDFERRLRQGELVQRHLPAHVMGYYNARREVDKADARVLLGITAGHQPGTGTHTPGGESTLSNRKRKELEKQQREEERKKKQRQEPQPDHHKSTTKRMPDLAKQIKPKFGKFLEFCKETASDLTAGDDAPCITMHVMGVCKRKHCKFNHDDLPDAKYDKFWETGQKFVDSL